MFEVMHMFMQKQIHNSSFSWDTALKSLALVTAPLFTAEVKLGKIWEDIYFQTFSGWKMWKGKPPPLFNFKEKKLLFQSAFLNMSNLNQIYDQIHVLLENMTLLQLWWNKIYACGKLLHWGAMFRSSAAGDLWQC